jgi:hypothetical protein
LNGYQSILNRAMPRTGNGCADWIPSIVSFVAPGAIRNLDRYRQLYDHSGWYGKLPNKITPSDIDVVFDNKNHGRILFCEFTSAEATWDKKPYGQRIAYMQLLRTTAQKHAAVLCLHHVPSDKQIDTVLDVDSFHVMRILDKEKGVVLMPSSHEVYDGSKWLDFVKSFYGLENSTFGEWL